MSVFVEINKVSEIVFVKMLETIRWTLQAFHEINVLINIKTFAQLV